MECDPALSVDVAKVVCPPASRMPLPIAFAPSLKVTVPVATDAPPLTDTPNVTKSPKSEGFLSELMEVVVGHTPLSATRAVNGVLVRPEVVKFRISTPGPYPEVSVPTLKRIRTACPAYVVPRFTVTGMNVTG